MSILTSKLSLQDKIAQNNRTAMQAVNDLAASRAKKLLQGGSEKSRARHISRGKLLPRTRIDRLLDKGAPFLEIGLFAA